MKETLNLDSKTLNGFRQMFDISLRHLMINMEDKDMESGTITGKITIKRETAANRETGEIRTFVHMKPSVSVKLGVNGKADCEEIKGMQMAFDRNGDPIIADEQISMDEIIGKGA